MKARQTKIDSDQSTDLVRQRVSKACDRCRLKKSKCDGANQCSRCRMDNAICVFGEHKRTNHKEYPKGYVELLEQQHAWLVKGLQELYWRSTESDGWPSDRLNLQPCGQPSTHNLLISLGAIDHTKSERFVEDREAIKWDYWHNDSQHLESSSASSISPQPQVISSHLPSGNISGPESLSTPLPVDKAPNGPHIWHQPITGSSQHSLVNGLPMQDAANSFALQDDPQQWLDSQFGLFNQADLQFSMEFSSL